MDIFDYDNVLLLPRKCRVDSRSECDTSVEFGGRRFHLPAVPSNMKTVIDETIAQMLAREGREAVACVLPGGFPASALAANNRRL